MSHDDFIWQKLYVRSPEEGPPRYPEGVAQYTIDLEGRVYTAAPEGRWEISAEREGMASERLKHAMLEAYKENRVILPVSWPGATKLDLYYDPRRVLPIALLCIAPREMPKMNSLASAARIFAFMSLLFGPCALVALICGYAALGQIRDRGERGRDVAMTGIVIGWVIVGFYILLVVLIASH